MVQFYIRHFRPKFLGYVTKLIYLNSGIRIGKNFRCDSIPRILIDKACKLSIGDNVEFRRNIEIRVHGGSKIVIASNVRIDRGVRLLSANESKIELKTGVRVGLYTVFNGGDDITVGEKSLISGFVYLQTSMHAYAQSAMAVQDQGYSHAPVKLEQDVWLGTHVVVMPGVTIAKGCVVGSNAVVTKSVGEYQIIAGIPAKTIKERV